MKRLTEAEQMQIIKNENQRKDFLFEAFDDLLEKTQSKIVCRNAGSVQFEEFHSCFATATDIQGHHLVLSLNNEKEVSPVYSIPEVAKYLRLGTDHLFLEIGKKDGKWWLWNIKSIGSHLEDLAGEDGLQYVNMSIHPALCPTPISEKDKLN